MPSEADIASLLERVRLAEGPDRELDLQLGLTLGGWRHLEPDARGDEWLKADDTYYPWPTYPGQDWPSFTESLDTALALVERVAPGAVWSVCTDFGGYVGAHIAIDTVGMERPLYVTEQAATPALSLVAALLVAVGGTSRPSDAASVDEAQRLNTLQKGQPNG